MAVRAFLVNMQLCVPLTDAECHTAQCVPDARRMLVGGELHTLRTVMVAPESDTGRWLARNAYCAALTVSTASPDLISGLLDPRSLHFLGAAKAAPYVVEAFATVDLRFADTDEYRASLEAATAWADSTELPVPQYVETPAHGAICSVPRESLCADSLQKHGDLLVGLHEFEVLGKALRTPAAGLAYVTQRVQQAQVPGLLARPLCSYVLDYANPMTTNLVRVPYEFDVFDPDAPAQAQQRVRELVHHLETLDAAGAAADDDSDSD